MTPHNSEEYVLAIGATSNVLAEFDVAMFWPLSAEVLSPAKQDDLSDLLNSMRYIIYNMITNRKLYLVHNDVRLLEVPA